MTHTPQGNAIRACSACLSVVQAAVPKPYPPLDAAAVHSSVNDPAIVTLALLKHYTIPIANTNTIYPHMLSFVTFALI